MLSSPAQKRSEENRPKLEAQILTFKENVETQLQVLSHKFVELNNTININKQELLYANCPAKIYILNHASRSWRRDCCQRIQQMGLVT